MFTYNLKLLADTTLRTNNEKIEKKIEKKVTDDVEQNKILV